MHHLTARGLFLENSQSLLSPTGQRSTAHVTAASHLHLTKAYCGILSTLFTDDVQTEAREFK